ncbi:SipW-dependent-type signal peptide-containing protein [Rubneribacter sp.]
MEQETSKKRSKKGIVAAVLACCLVVGGVAGVLAWLTTSEDAENVFTIGNFKPPTVQPNPTDPDTPDPDTPVVDDDEFLSGYLTETNWEPDAKITPGVSIEKNPNVGLGAGSDPAYVFLYVKSETLTDNSAANIALHAPVFALEAGWSAVADYTHSTSDTNTETGYTDGLFVYSGASGTDPVKLVTEATGNGAYTGEVFKTVAAPQKADMDQYKSGTGADAPKITVYAYIYAADDTEAEGSATSALAAAQIWAEDLGFKL